MIDTETAHRALALAASRQSLYSGPDKPPNTEKAAAKLRAAAIVGAQPGARVLDVGGEEFYRPAFEANGLTIEPLNLPADMHELRAEHEYDGALAMHVLEHSPFPLYVLLLIHRALRPGGFLYVAVPHPRDKWIRHAAHFTVLPPDAWARLLEDAAFRVEQREDGPFGPRSREERFLCRAI